MIKKNSFQLERPPLVHVVSLLEFNPVEEGELKKFVEELAIGLRSFGFLDYKDKVIYNVGFNLDVNWSVENNIHDQLKPIEHSTSTSYVFIHTDNKLNFVVTRNFVALQASIYENFQTFCDVLMSCLEIVKKTIQGFVEVRKVGLRYINLIPLAESKASEWIHGQLLGSDLEAFKGYTYSNKIERLYQLDNGWLALRCNDLLKDSPPIPQGVDLTGLQIPSSIQKLASKVPIDPFMFFEIDRVSTDKRKFDLTVLRELFVEFNTAAEKAFIGCTTDEARESWGKKS